MPLPPPLKSSAAMRAASTDPMPLVSWKMPEMSLSTPTAHDVVGDVARAAAPRATGRRAGQAPAAGPFESSSMIVLPSDLLLLELVRRRLQAGVMVTGRLSSPRSVLL